MPDNSPAAATTVAAEADIIRPRLRTDHHIWGIYIVLLIFSVIELFSASSQEVRVDDIYGPLVRHAQFLVAGFGIMLVIQIGRASCREGVLPPV